MYAALLTGLSSAALSILARLASKEIIENILETLVRKGAVYLAAKTGNTVDDEIARIIAERLRTPADPQK